MQKLHEKKSYWFFWVMESRRRAELTVDVLIYTFLAAFICLVAHFFEWTFFLRGILDYVITFLLFFLFTLPFLVFWYTNQEEKAREHYRELNELIKLEENNESNTDNA
jgi:glucan phosphoethanolaminetransferase (alkaline phosphatase superfamily)